MAKPQTAVAVVDPKSAPPSSMGQLSYSGTPKIREVTRPDEYVTDLREPPRRMEIFDEMRGSDEAVGTALSTRENLIGSSNWLLSTAGDTPKEKELLEFAEDNIYPLLGKLLRDMSGALQYGFGAVEKIHEWSDKPFARNIVRGKLRRATKQIGRKIYLRKLAQIRQRTVYTFTVPQSDLESVRQYVFDGYSFKKVDIPRDKMLLWTYNRRGDDYWGVPPLRSCYRAWKFKQQLEKLNLLGVDRFGVGTPVAEEGEGWSEPDRKRLHDFLTAWRSGQNTFLAHPMGGKISIVSGDGRIVMSVLEWTKFYNLAIAKTYLTQLSELGSTETGSRAVGDSFTSQLESVVQSDCEDIANIVNEELIVPLIDMNFGPQDSYPLFAPSARLHISIELAQTLKAIKDSGGIVWEPKDEQWLRDGLGMPEIDLAVRQAEFEKKKIQADKAAQAAIDSPNPPGQLPAGQPQRALPPGRPNPATPATVPLRALSISPDPSLLPFRTAQFSEWESRVLRPDIVGRDLDLAQVRLTGEVQDVLREIDQELRDEATALAADGPTAIAANVRNIAVSGALKRKLRTAMLKAADRIRSYGYDSVHAEIARQANVDTVGPTRSPRSGLRRLAAQLTDALLAADPTPEELQRNLAVSAEVDRAVEDEVARREGSVRSSLLTAIQMAGALSIVQFGSVIKQAVQQALESLSPARTNDNVGGVINVAFGAGRSDATAEIVAGSGGGGGSGDGGNGVVGSISGPIAKVYSAVMDGGTCEECAKWDGGQFPIDYPEDVTGVQAPNPRCAGGYGRCRCVWILITDREVASTVPSAKGPQDYPSTKLTRRIEALEARRPEPAPTINVAAPVIDFSKMPPIELHVSVDAKRGPVRMRARKDPETNEITMETIDA